MKWFNLAAIAVLGITEVGFSQTRVAAPRTGSTTATGTGSSTGSARTFAPGQIQGQAYEGNHGVKGKLSKAEFGNQNSSVQLGGTAAVSEEVSLEATSVSDRPELISLGQAAASVSSQLSSTNIVIEPLLAQAGEFESAEAISRVEELVTAVDNYAATTEGLDSEVAAVKYAAREIKIDHSAIAKSCDIPELL